MPKLTKKEKKALDLMTDQSRLLIDSLIKTRGPIPDYVDQEDMVESAREKISVIILKNRPNIPDMGDIRVDLEQYLSETFYNVRGRGGLCKRKSISEEGSLLMNSSQEKMFYEYLNFVDAVIRKTINTKYLPGAIDYSDLNQLGAIALIRAIKSYDPQYPFVPYAKRLIKNALLDAISNNTSRADDGALSLNAMIDDGKSENDASDLIQGKLAKKNPCLFISTEDAYEIKEIVSVIASIRDANHGCLKIGLDAIIECNINGYPMIDYAANINKPVKVLSAYISKAKSYLKTNQEFLDAITHR